IHETNRSGLMQFVPEFLKSRTTHNISLLLIFWSLWPLPGYPPQRIPRKGSRQSAGSSPCIPAPEFNKPPTGGRDRPDDPPIRQFFFDAAVIAEDVDRHVFPESGKIRHSPKDDRLRGNENITSPTPRPFMGAAKP